MNGLVNLQEVQNRFCLTNDNPDLEKTTNLNLLQLLAYAPPGSMAIGRVDRVEQSYLASIEVQSSFRCLSAKAMGTTEPAAVKRVLEKLEDQLFQWRFGGGPGLLHSHCVNPAGIYEAI
jgi:hypothetical protein